MPSAKQFPATLFNTKHTRSLLAATFFAAALNGAVAGTIELEPVMDIWTTSYYSYDGNSRNGGIGGGLDNDRLLVGGWGDEYRSLLQFDLSGISQPLTSARLDLFNTGSVSGTPVSMFLDRVTSEWDWTDNKIDAGTLDRNRLWWDDRPSFVQTATLAAPTVMSSYSVDVTDIVNGQLSGAFENYGFQLRPTSTANRFNDFASSENSTEGWRPKLVLETGPTTAVIPSLSELSQMAQCAYSGSCLIPGFTQIPIDSIATAPSTFSAVALADLDGSRVVLSITGTNDITDWLDVNPTFIKWDGSPTPLFLEYVDAAADALKSLSDEYPNAEIFLTGHSLGGALAQVLADASGFSAITFNAPGAQQTLTYFSSDSYGQLGDLSNPRGTQVINNVRIYGDLVSTVGTQFGSTTTYEPPIPQWQVDTFPVGTAKSMHEMLFVHERIVNNAPTIDDLGPVASEAVASTVFDVSGAVYSGPRSLIIPLTSAVVAGVEFWVDPEDLDLYQFSADPGSPLIRSVVFPSLFDVDALFDLELLVEDMWTSLGLFEELSVYDFGLTGVDQFRFFVLERNSLQPPESISPFSFGVTFVTDGYFSGTVFAESTIQHSVPEPPILGLFLLGFLSITIVGKNRRSVS